MLTRPSPNKSLGCVLLPTLLATPVAAHNVETARCGTTFHDQILSPCWKIRACLVAKAESFAKDCNCRWRCLTTILRATAEAVLALPGHSRHQKLPFLHLELIDCNGLELRQMAQSSSHLRHLMSRLHLEHHHQKQTFKPPRV